MSTPAGKETIVSVIEHDGTRWTLNDAVPGDTTTKVVRMFLVDGVVEIFALPITGSDLEKMGQGLHFTLMPLSIKCVCAAASFIDWQRLVAETEQVLADDGDDEDEDDEEDEEDDEDDSPSSGPVAYGPPPAAGYGPPPALASAATAPLPVGSTTPAPLPAPVAAPSTHSPYMPTAVPSVTAIPIEAEPAPGQ